MLGYRLATFLLASALLPLSAEAKLEQYRLDPVHTRVAFQVSHAGFSNPVGSFSGVQGELRFDPDDWASASVEVRIPLATLATAKRNGKCFQEPDHNWKEIEVSIHSSG